MRALATAALVAALAFVAVAQAEPVTTANADAVRRTMAAAQAERLRDAARVKALDDATPPAELSRYHNPTPRFEAFWSQTYDRQPALAFERLWTMQGTPPPGLVVGLLRVVATEPADRAARLTALMHKYTEAEELAAQYAGAAVAPELLARARDPRRERIARLSAALAIGKTKASPTIARELIELASEASQPTELRAAAAQSACSLGGIDPALPFALLTDSDEQIRERTAIALVAGLDGTKLRALLADRRASSSAVHRRGAAYLARHIPAEEGVPLGLELASDQAAAVRREAFETLLLHIVRLRVQKRPVDPRVRTLLSSAKSSDADPSVRQVAERALDQLAK